MGWGKAWGGGYFRLRHDDYCTVTLIHVNGMSEDNEDNSLANGCNRSRILSHLQRTFMEIFLPFTPVKHNTHLCFEDADADFTVKGGLPGI